MKKSLFSFLSFILIITAAAAQDTSLQQYTGKFRFPDGSVVAEVNVSIENGVLMMSSSAGTSSLQLIKGDTFSIVSFNGTAVFKRNESARINGVHIDAGGYVLDGTKDEEKLTFSSLNDTGSAGMKTNSDYHPSIARHAGKRYGSKSKLQMEAAEYTKTGS